jgi:sugar-specific transcriptional regulator TrmB
MPIEGDSPMTDEKQLSLEILSEFGLTDNQAKVFIAATKLGNPTVSEVAEASEVRREEVYRLLPDLEKMGLIERLLGRPLRLKTLDPKSSITTLVKLERERAKDRIEELSVKSKELLVYLGHTGEVTHDEDYDSEFSLLREKESVRIGFYDLISKATKSLEVLLSRKDLIWLVSTQGEALQKAFARKVKIRMLSEPTAARDRIPKILRRLFSEEGSMPLKYLLSPKAYFLIADGQKMALITSETEFLPSANCLLTNNTSLVTMALGSFESHWHDSVHWKTVEGIALSVSPQNRPEEGTAHVHRILLYKSQDVEHKVLFNFLRERIDADYLVLYVCSQDCIKDTKNAMQEFGFDKKQIDEAKNLRVLDWNRWMLNDGEFSIEKAIDVWDDLYFEAQDLGFKGIGVAADMQFFFDNEMIEEMLEYEKQIQKVVGGQIELKCAYNEKSILANENPLYLYGRLIGYHTAVLSEEKSLP